MLKLGDRLEWFDDADYSAGNAGKGYEERGTLEKFAVLCGDQDFSGFERRVINSHPDPALKPDYGYSKADGSNGGYNANWARYQAVAGTGQGRGPVDSNYAFQDGSVRMLRRVTLDYDDRMGQVPFCVQGWNWSIWTYQLPRNY